MLYDKAMQLCSKESLICPWILRRTLINPDTEEVWNQDMHVFSQLDENAIENLISYSTVDNVHLLSAITGEVLLVEDFI